MLDRASLRLAFSGWLALFLLAGIFAVSGACQAEPVTVLVPSSPAIEKQPARNQGKAKDGEAEPMEVDILISMMRPYENTGVDMDRPQLFASLRYPEKPENGKSEPERKDLLGDVEEIRYLDHKAWGANVALETPGLYQFILEAKPWWNEEKNFFEQQQAKVMLPVQGTENGWELASGQFFEILPLTRPFGLAAPALFSGRVLLNGEPLANAQVFMGRINADKSAAPTVWHKKMEARSDSSGQFAFVLNRPGWWYCEATIAGDPLKGPDGQPKPVLRSSIMWLFVDGYADEKNRR